MSHKFVSSFNQQTKQNITHTKSFLQIANFPNQKTNLYHVRKFVINTDNEFVNIKEYFLNKHTYDKLLNIKKKHEYKLYAVYDLNTVEYPTMADILILKSDILGANYNYYGFSPF